MNYRHFLVVLVVVLLCRCTETKSRNRGRHSQSRRLRELCRLQKASRSSRGNSALELHAFFDLRPRDKAFACLKVSTCRGTPVCFVTSYPRMKSKTVNDSTTWQDVIKFIQSDRKIEPIYDSSKNGWNDDKYKILSHYVQNQPAIYRMCRDAMIYRFVANDNGNSTSQGKRAINSSSPSAPQNASKITKATAPILDPISLCPLFAKRKAHRRDHRRRKSKSMRTKRVDRSRRNVTANNFMLCQGINCPCVRICVGQGRKQQTFSDCSTFRIICTFNCGQDAGVFSSLSPKLSRKRNKPTKRARRRPKKRPKSKRGGYRKKNGK